jgi:hypothetical protein
MLLDHSESGGLRNQALRSAQVVRIASTALKDVAGLVNGDLPRTARAQSLRARARTRSGRGPCGRAQMRSYPGSWERSRLSVIISAADQTLLSVVASALSTYLRRVEALASARTEPVNVTGHRTSRNLLGAFATFR